MRRLVGFLIVLILVLVVADRVACHVAEGKIADKIQNTEHLTSRPDVAVHGFPFLTQALHGRYRRVDASVQDLTVQQGLTIESVNVELRGLRVKTADVLNGTVTRVPVDSATTVATVSYPALNQAAKANLPDKGLTVQFGPGPGSDLLAVTGTYAGPQLKAQINAQARVSIRDGDLVVGLLPSTLASLPSPIRAQLTSLLGGGYKLPRLPFGFEAKSVTVGHTAITVRAKATSVTLG
jgi:LmeA-like phospholipid-binding